jgi:two-component system LytT family response regulator
VRILIADDEPIAREILREHIESMPSLEVAGEASTGAETLARIFEIKPDLVLLDLQMPELDGLAVVRALRGEHRPAIIFVTAFERHALDAFEVGAVDYLLKPVGGSGSKRRLQRFSSNRKVPKVSPARRARSWGAAAAICICWMPLKSSRFRWRANWFTSLRRRGAT